MKKRKWEVRLIPAQDLRVHPHAQRDLVQSKVKQLAAELDLDAIGVLHGVQYEIDGVTAVWIIDGQTRLSALLQHGLGEWEVDVKIHLDVKDDARAADLFLKLNYRSVVRPYDKFKNALTARRSGAVGIAKLAEERNLKVTHAGGDGSMHCISALTSLYNRDNGVALAATLDTLIQSWGRIAAALEGKLIEGLGLVYATYNGTVDRPVLAKKLSKYPGGPSALLGDAKGIRQYRHVSLSRCVAERIIEVYNSGKISNKLDPL